MPHHQFQHLTLNSLTRSLAFSEQSNANPQQPHYRQSLALVDVSIVPEWSVVCIVTCQPMLPDNL